MNARERCRARRHQRRKAERETLLADRRLAQRIECTLLGVSPAVLRTMPVIERRKPESAENTLWLSALYRTY